MQAEQVVQVHLEEPMAKALQDIQVEQVGHRDHVDPQDQAGVQEVPQFFKLIAST